MQRLKFLGVMMPAALADSINPCAFAVMFLLLTAILSRYKSKKKALFAGLLFALSIFISYFAM
jgi:cytochrome c biogenesis protein CcdA